VNIKNVRIRILLKFAHGAGFANTVLGSCTRAQGVPVQIVRRQCSRACAICLNIFD
jgi:hypothetical protein